MKFFAPLMMLLLILAPASFGRSPRPLQRRAVLAQAQQRLTEEQFDNFVFYWEMYLDIKLTRDEREELKRDVIQYWTTNNTAEIRNTLKQAEYGAANRDLPQSALADMRTAYQAQHLAGLRSEPNDPMSVLLLKIYNRVHGFGGGSANSPEAGAVLADGNPPLTQDMADKFFAFYEFILDLKFSAEQRNQLQSVMIEGWRKNNRDVIDRVVGDLKFVDHKTKEEVKAALHEDYQVTIVSVMRQYLSNPLLARLLEDFDRAHPDRREATRSKGFADLVGTWKWADSLLPGRNPYNKEATGISYTDSRTLEIAPDGQFKRMHAHSHCEGGMACCRQDGTTEYGTVSIENSRLIFQVKSGTEIVRDGCNARLNQQSAIRPRRESFVWNINFNQLHNAPALCWTGESGEAVCYYKER